MCTIASYSKNEVQVIYVMIARAPLNTLSTRTWTKKNNSMRATKNKRFVTAKWNSYEQANDDDDVQKKNNSGTSTKTTK